MSLVLSNVSAFVANPALVKTVALGAIVTVKNITDVCATLFRLVGSLHGALVYEQYLSSRDSEKGKCHEAARAWEVAGRIAEPDHARGPSRNRPDSTAGPPPPSEKVVQK